MTLTFNDETTVDIINLNEQMVNRDKNVWSLMCTITSPMTQETVDTILTEENISSMTVSSGETDKIISGYNAVVVVSIRYDENLNTTTDVQLRKFEGV
ncbi:MAG: hypothetical protein M0R40_00670 [Firmicutes bacterium]|nr:hypothetical protein [Bacillota bacterium]